MRPVQLADIETAARMLLCLAPDARQQAMQRLIAQTCQADRYRTATGFPHPRFGCGTLLSCASHHPLAPRPAALGPDALHAYCVVLQGLMACRSHHRA